MSEAPERDANGNLSLVVQMNPNGFLSYYLNGSTTPVNTIDIGEIREGLGDLLIQTFSAHPTIVISNRLEIPELVLMLNKVCHQI